MTTTHTLYPTITQYCNAIRHPKMAFRKKDPTTKVESELDSLLVAGKPVEITNSNGIKDLWSAAGGFACVFKYETFNPKKLWAVRCFLQSTSSVANHYSKVSTRLKNIPCSSYFVECSFLDKGIRVDGKLYPTVKMEWVEGKDLRTFIRDNLNDKSKLESLAQAWVKLSKDLLDAGIAHGDLQHGNILVDDRNGINLKLIDYDSLYFSVDGNSINDEIKGILDYQHPLRATLKKQCMQIDFFSQLVIYLSIIVITEKPQLWNSYKLDHTERLLFSKTDFPNLSSPVFNEISQLSPDIARLTDEFKKICKLTDFSKIPSLDAVLKIVTPSPVGPVYGTSLFIGTQSNQQTNQQRNSPSSSPQPIKTTGIFTSVQPNQQGNSPSISPQPIKTTGIFTSAQPNTQKNSPSISPQPIKTTGIFTSAQPNTQKNSPSISPQPIKTTGIFTSAQQNTNLQPQSGAANSMPAQPINTSQTSAIQITKKANSPVWIKAVAVVSTAVAAALGVFCYYQYQENNQIKQQIERIRSKNSLLPLQWKIDNLASSVELQNFLNMLNGEKSFLYLDIEDLVKQLEKKNLSIISENGILKEERDRLRTRVNKLEDANKNWQKERDRLQTQVNDLNNQQKQLENANKNWQKERDRLQTQVNDLNNRQKQLETDNIALQKERDRLQSQVNEYEQY